MKLGPIVALLLAGTIMPTSAGAQSPARPVFLEAEAIGDQIRIQVVGYSDHPVTVRYRLEAESGSGGNRSVQSGVAHLQTKDRKTLISLALRSGTKGDWKARLIAEVEGGQSYETELGWTEARSSN